MLVEQDVSQGEPTATERHFTFSFSLQTLFSFFLIQGEFHMQRQAVPPRASRVAQVQPRQTQAYEEEDYRDQEPFRAPRSALRYTSVATPPPARTTETLPAPKKRWFPQWDWSDPQVKQLRNVLVGLLAFLVLDATASGAWQAMSDHLMYGDYPTTHIDAKFGHGGMSHVLAFEDGQTVEIIEIIGQRTSGYAVKISTPARRVVKLTVEDVNGDGKLDILVSIEGVAQQPCLLNTGKGFEWSVVR